MNEWIVFAVTAAGIVSALALMTAGVAGNCRFGCAANRIHAAGIGDTLGIALLTIALAVSAPTVSTAAKLFLPLVFLWITSPVSSHLLALIEYTRTAQNKNKSERS